MPLRDADPFAKLNFSRVKMDGEEGSQENPSKFQESGNDILNFINPSVVLSFDDHHFN